MVRKKLQIFVYRIIGYPKLGICHVIYMVSYIHTLRKTNAREIPLAMLLVTSFPVVYRMRFVFGARKSPDISHILMFYFLCFPLVM